MLSNWRIHLFPGSHPSFDDGDWSAGRAFAMHANADKVPSRGILRGNALEVRSVLEGNHVFMASVLSCARLS